MSTASVVRAGTRKAGNIQRLMALAHIALGIVLGALGGGMIASLPWAEGRQYLAARDWPATQATIVSLNITEESHADVQRSGSVVSETVLKVLYEFEVAGEIIEGTQATFSDRASVYDRKLRAVYGRLHFARLMGRTVAVAYDPANPSSAYLDRSFDWHAPAWRAGVATLALLFGAGLVIGGLRARA